MPVQTFSFIASFNTLLCQQDNKNSHLQGDVERLLEDGSLDENVESFLSQDDMDPRETMGRCMDSSKGLLLFPTDVLLFLSQSDNSYYYFSHAFWFGI
jgi:hypothetical protein